jgi:beta-1,4-N-acetylglucosaminyltransferase
MAGPTSIESLPTKRCFVTIGATAPFDDLLRAVFRPSFLQALHDAHYTELRIQYGKEGQAVYEECTSGLLNIARQGLGIDISGFAFTTDGLAEEMLAAKGHPKAREKGEAVEGAVISHAGSGTILDALRISVPLIVVPNSALLHNHQVELAEELAEQHYVVHGKLDKLAESIPQVEALQESMRQWPPPTKGEYKYQTGLKGIMDDEMGWVD